ncbi:MAG: hypothetical protein Q8942_15400 [Bacillota bacterium]|nr:hypothetical protein [Bacillota bacterium]
MPQNLIREGIEKEKKFGTKSGLAIGRPERKNGGVDRRDKNMNRIKLIISLSCGMLVV